MGEIFLSYSRHSAVSIDVLATDMKELGHSVWFDQELSGGQHWWNQILTSVRACDVFVFALTPQSLDSVACKREYGYAAALGKPILPVLLSDGVSTNLLPPVLAQIQFLDYRNQDRAATFRLAKALASVPQAGPLPDPLPALPDVPISYLGGLAERSSKTDLNLSEQKALVFDLMRALGDIEARDDALVILKDMLKRRDLYAEIAEEIKGLIATQSAQLGRLDHATESRVRPVENGQSVTPLTGSADPPAPQPDATRARAVAPHHPPVLDQEEADYDSISVEARSAMGGEGVIEYALDTARARRQIRGARAQSPLVRELVATASNESGDRRIGRTLFRLLIPEVLEAYLGGTLKMVMELDQATASIPWELLDVNRGEESDQRPWAVRVKLVRKLRLHTFRDHVVAADSHASALVIGEPACPPEYPRLDGARSEAIAVRTCLIGSSALEAGKVTLLTGSDSSKLGPTAEEVMNTLFEEDWSIMHIAGHGEPSENGKPGGVVLSNGTFLGPNEIGSMRVVPELVFVNCCHVGRGDVSQLVAPRYDRVSFASGVAAALIEIGVRCVVATGWAVDEDAAIEFASAFYASLLRGNSFIDAVGNAREAAYLHSPTGNTWGAYQCYGDPRWFLRPSAAVRPI